MQFLLLLPLDGVNAQVKKITSESETASPFMNISCVINGQFRLLRLHQKRRCENEFGVSLLCRRISMLQKLQFCRDDGFISTALESRISISNAGQYSKRQKPAA